MKEFPKLGSKVRITGIKSIYEAESFIGLIENTMAIVHQSGTSEDRILCESPSLKKYFSISKNDVEPFYPLGKIYIAGAITGLPLEKAKENFAYAEEFLKKLGFEAINPMTIEHPEAKELESMFEAAKETMNISEIAKFQREIHKAYMKGCLCAVLDSEQVAVLDGWEKSKGATMETFVAHEYGYKIYKFPEMDIINIL